MVTVKGLSETVTSEIQPKSTEKKLTFYTLLKTVWKLVPDLKWLGVFANSVEENTWTLTRKRRM